MNLIKLAMTSAGLAVVGMGVNAPEAAEAGNVSINYSNGYNGVSVGYSNITPVAVRPACGPGYGGPVYGGPVYGGPVYGGPVYGPRPGFGYNNHNYRSNRYNHHRSSTIAVPHGDHYDVINTRNNGWNNGNNGHHHHH